MGDAAGINLVVMSDQSRPNKGPAAASRVWTAIELFFGFGLLAAAALAGLLLAKRPGPNRVDAAGYFYVPSDPHSHLANELVRIGSLPVLLIGVAVIFLVAIFRDWVRAVACAVGPIVAVEVVEHVAKPMVARQIGALCHRRHRRGVGRRGSSLFPGCSGSPAVAPVREKPGDRTNRRASSSARVHRQH